MTCRVLLSPPPPLSQSHEIPAPLLTPQPNSFTHPFHLSFSAPTKPPRKCNSVPASPTMPRALQRLVGPNQPVQLPVPIPVNADNDDRTVVPSDIAASKKASVYQGKLFRKIQQLTSTDGDDLDCSGELESEEGRKKGRKEERKE